MHRLIHRDWGLRECKLLRFGGAIVSPVIRKGPYHEQDKSSQEGGCRCGQVRIKVSSAPFLTLACHSTGCQRMTGSAFTLSAAILNQGFAITKGDPVIGGLHGATRHFLCPHCMSWMFTRPDGFDIVILRATSITDGSWPISAPQKSISRCCAGHALVVAPAAQDAVDAIP